MTARISTSGIVARIGIIAAILVAARTGALNEASKVIAQLWVDALTP